MEFRNDYPPGTLIRTLKDGLEGIIIDRVRIFSDYYRYIIEMRHGETVMESADQVLPIDHPVHAQLETWKTLGIHRGFKSIMVGYDEKGAWYCIFHSSPRQYDDSMVK